MARVIKFDYEDTVYTIQFDRKVFVNAESAGFNMEKSVQTPLKSMTMLFMFALQKSHPTLQLNKVDKILDQFIKEFGVDEFLAFAFEEYTDFFPTTQEDSGKKKPLEIQNI